MARRMRVKRTSKRNDRRIASLLRGDKTVGRLATTSSTEYQGPSEYSSTNRALKTGAELSSTEDHTESPTDRLHSLGFHIIKPRIAKEVSLADTFKPDHKAIDPEVKKQYTEIDRAVDRYWQRRGSNAFGRSTALFTTAGEDSKQAKYVLGRSAGMTETGARKLSEKEPLIRYRSGEGAEAASGVCRSCNTLRSMSGSCEC